MIGLGNSYFHWNQSEAKLKKRDSDTRFFKQFEYLFCLYFITTSSCETLAFCADVIRLACHAIIPQPPHKNTVGVERLRDVTSLTTFAKEERGTLNFSFQHSTEKPSWRLKFASYRRKPPLKTGIVLSLGNPIGRLSTYI